MAKFDSILKLKDYPEIVQLLVESNDENLIDIYEKNHLYFNVGFYPYLIEAAEQALAECKNDSGKAKKIRHILTHLQKRNNVFPIGDLPKVIVFDRRLELLLFDDSSVVSTPKKMEEWRERIKSQIDGLPRKQHQEFITWCIGQMDLNCSRHRKSCPNDPSTCAIEEGLEKRILYLQGLLDDAEPDPLDSPEKGARKPLVRIQWLGDQKELAELFIELKKKGWIAKFENATIKACFTPSDSMPDYLKPFTNKKTMQPTYEKVYFESDYSPKFYGIKENPKGTSD